MESQGNLSPEDLFFKQTVESYVTKNARFLRRDWLAQAVDERMDAPNSRFVLLTAEPGAGKSTFLAQLADDHSEWLRYFIRSNQQTPLGDVGVRSFLLRIGFQLAALHQDLFTQESIRVSVEQRIGQVQASAAVVGAEVKRILASPFIQKTIDIRQTIEQNAGRVTGLIVDEWVMETRQLALSDLQHMALIDPCRTLYLREPDRKIVILVDALDEIRYHATQDDILQWLTNCPELPPNICFVLSSRPPDPRLRLFVDKQGAAVQVLKIDPADQPVQNDVRKYIGRLLAQPQVAAALARKTRDEGSFSELLAEKADGNLGYLDALARAVDHALMRSDMEILDAILDVEELPKALEELYGFFLHQIRAQVLESRLAVPVPGSEPGETLFLRAWSSVYMPLLAILSAALEPLSPDQLKAYGGIIASLDFINETLDHLHQFLDDVGGRYRLYHATLPEFLTAESTNANPRNRDLYQDPVESNRKIVGYYQRKVGGWTADGWSRLDSYGWHHLLAHARAADVPDSPAMVFDICDGGYLKAKYEAMISAAQLEGDWALVFKACRDLNDYDRFFRYGLVRAGQFMHIAAMASTPVARTAAQLAVQGGSEGEIERLAAEIALVPHLDARILAQLAFLEVLLPSQPDSPVLDRTYNSLEVTLCSFPPGEDRDRYLVDYIESEVKVERDGWLEKANGYLEEIQSTLPKIRLNVILARKYGEMGDLETGYQRIKAALKECKKYKPGDDIVPELLQMTEGVSYDSPALYLTHALTQILEAAPALGPSHCAEIVAKARKQSKRLMKQFITTDGALQTLQVERAAILALEDVGLHIPASEAARGVIQPYLAQSVEPEEPDVEEYYDYPGLLVEYLTILPTLAGFGTPADLDVWWDVFESYLAGIQSPLDLVWVLETITDLLTHHVDVPLVLDLLDKVETRAKALDPDTADFEVVAAFALGYGRAGNLARCWELVNLALEQYDLHQPPYSGEPADLEALADGVIHLWSAACLSEDRDLVRRALAWMQAAALTQIPFDIRPQVWIQAITALKDIPDREQAAAAFDPLKRQFIENRAFEPFLATAFRQFAEAYAMLERPTHVRNFIEESLELGRNAFDLVYLVDLMASSARIYARIGDYEKSAGLLEEILQWFPVIEDDWFRADCLGSIITGIRALADESPVGKEYAARLLQSANEIALSMDQLEPALRVFEALLWASKKYELTIPGGSISRRLKELQVDAEPDVRLKVALLYHQLGLERNALEILAGVEKLVEQMPIQDDFQRDRVCWDCEYLIAFYDGIGDINGSQHWRQLAQTLVDQIEDPSNRTSACTKLSRIEGRFENYQRAGSLFNEAVQAWHAIEDRFYANPYLWGLFQTWDLIPDPEVRWEHVETMMTVFNRVQDLNERDIGLARMAASFVSEPEKFWGLMDLVVAQGGIDVVLSSIYASGSLPPGVLPEALYNMLEKASRLSPINFAGFALLATQAGIFHQAIDPEEAAAVLEMIEKTMRVAI